MYPDFDLPSRGSISGRTSSITAAFFQAITPVIEPSEEEVDEALAILGMARGSVPLRLLRGYAHGMGSFQADRDQSAADRIRH